MSHNGTQPFTDLNDYIQRKKEEESVTPNPLKRYDQVEKFSCGIYHLELEPSPEGEWVRWSDAQEAVEFYQKHMNAPSLQEFIDNFNNRTLNP